MNVGELRELLEDYDDDTEVRMMISPDWPTVHGVHGLWYPPKHATEREENEAMYDEDGNVADDRDERLEHILYILQGERPERVNPYGDAKAWEEAEVCP